ncbi:MAG: diguanylate cyclase [Acidobacteria bacterium]|nr:MAG: diguanylate cyclase [Acidobacteriota bacterium]
MSTPQILVVEDEGITAMDLEARLKRLGYSVPAVVSSGEEAILRAEETHPDLVLMDIVLRGQTDGVQAAQELQSRLGIPVVYLTAYFDDATLERAKATEPFGYIIKPFKDINLRTSIEIALRRHEAENAWLVARHGVESPVQYSVTPVADKEGNNGDAVSFFEAIDAVQVGETQRAEPLGVSETLVPSTPLSVVELKLAERMGLLEALVQNSPLATVVLDPQQRVLICNPVFGDLFLYQRQEILGHKLGELIKDYVTGTDTIEVSPSVLSGQVLRTTGRRCRSDGTVVDVGICGVPVFVNGKLEGVYVVYQDITERRRAEEALQQGNAVLRGWLQALEKRSEETTLLNEMVELLQTCVSAEEAYAVVTRSAQQLFPSEAGSLCVLNASQNLVEAVAIWGQPLVGERVFAPEDCWALRRGQVHAVEDPASGLVCRHLGVFRGVSYLCVPMMGQGEALGVLHVQSGSGAVERENHLTDAQQRLAVNTAGHIALALANLRLRETLRMQSIRDPLTGLFNRRYMEESLARELRRAARNQRRLGAIMLDLDKFKVFNDTYGHAAGDALLRKLGGFLRSRTRGEDIACRYGGEEFVVILPEASIEVTQQRAEQLREEFKFLTVQHRGQTLGALTLSVGVAVFPEHGTTVEDILHAVDTALYRAKAEGRDRVVTGKALE